MHSPSMPPLVDTPFFIPPPNGATNGGQPGAYGGRSVDQIASKWPATTNGTPYPTWPVSPTAPPTSAASWTYGAYTPWQPPVSTIQAPSAWGPPAAPSWGPYTPGGTWSATSPAASRGPPTPAAYSPWIMPQQQQQQGGTLITPNMLKPPSSPYHPGAGQSLAPGDSTIGYSGYPEEWNHASKPSTPKKPHKKRHSTHEFPRRPPLYRSTSWGEYPSQSTPVHPATGIPLYAKGDTFDDRNLARRPLDWRPDYKPRLSTWLSKNKTDVEDYVDPIKRSLHPLLHYTHSEPPIYQNLYETPFHSSSVEFLNLNRPHNDIDLAQLACQPSAAFLRLFHPRLPWYIDVHQIHPNGITVGAVVQQIHQQLQTQIHPRHFYNEDLTDSDRTEITQAFQNRCRNDPALITKGVLQIDYLGDKIIFEGLVRGPKGFWELKLSRKRF